MAVHALAINACLSVLGVYLSTRIVKEFIPIFIARGMFGRDQCKKGPAKTPEPMGVATAGVYLIVMFLFIPFAFVNWEAEREDFPFEKFVAFLSGLLSVCCSMLLGFADDVLDLRWRHKLLFPSLSSLPVLMVYWANGLSTSVVLPFGTGVLDIGFLYYVYMAMMVVFCFNAINILAGINGLEAGQSLIIAGSVILFNLVQLWRLDSQQWYHYLSLYFLMPYFSTTAVLLHFNWYPANVFVGDTFCYYSGMVLAVVGVLGHFSKTLMLFFLPQVANFLYSLPQLFKLVPCPRHRLPKYDAASDTVSMSIAEFKESELRLHGKLAVAVFASCGLLFCESFEKEGDRWLRVNNMTLINLCLKFFGPMHEKNLTLSLLALQIFCSLLAFSIRFFLAAVVYDVVH